MRRHPGRSISRPGVAVAWASRCGNCGRSWSKGCSEPEKRLRGTATLVAVGDAGWIGFRDDEAGSTTWDSRRLTVKPGGSVPSIAGRRRVATWAGLRMGSSRPTSGGPGAAAGSGGRRLRAAGNSTAAAIDDNHLQQTNRDDVGSVASIRERASAWTFVLPACFNITFPGLPGPWASCFAWFSSALPAPSHNRLGPHQQRRQTVLSTDNASSQPGNARKPFCAKMIWLRPTRSVNSSYAPSTNSIRNCCLAARHPHPTSNPRGNMAAGQDAAWINCTVTLRSIGHAALNRDLPGFGAQFRPCTPRLGLRSMSP